MRWLTLILVLCCLNLTAYSQSSGKYHKVDSLTRAKHIRTKNTYKISQQLTGSFHSQEEKARALFTWIADNIAYDVELSEDRNKLKSLRHKTSKYWIKRTLRKKKAICSGYSELYRILAVHANLQVQTVPGYSKTKVTDIASMRKPDHAWNKVKINGKWENIDVTWGSGYVNNRTGAFSRSFNDTYFMTPRSKFNMTHMPSNGYWVEGTDKITMAEFKNYPLIGRRYYDEMLEFDEYSKQGFREVVVGDTIKVKFTWDKWAFSSSVLPSFAKKVNGEYPSEDAHATRKDGIWTLIYVVKKAGRYYLDFYINYGHLASYRVYAKKKPIVL